MSERATNRPISLCILKVLEKHSDYQHGLNLNDIINYLDEEYDLPCERRTIRRHLDSLIDLGYDIEINGKEIYLGERTFEPSELRLLIDGVLASKNIPQKQAKDLIKKLESLQSEYFKSRTKHVYNLDTWTGHKQNALFYNIDTIDDAIENKNKIAFHYNKYGADKKLYKTREEKYIVNPYYMLMNGSKYYLVANMDKYDDIINFRIAQISDIEILKEKVKPKSKLSKHFSEFNLAKYAKEHIYMFGGESGHVAFMIDSSHIGEVIDWFGDEFNIQKDKDGKCRCTLTSNRDAFFYWALQYGKLIEVVEPKNLRDNLMETAKEMYFKYKNAE